MEMSAENRIVPRKSQNKRNHKGNEKDKDNEHMSGVGPWSRLWRDHRFVSGSSWHKMLPYRSVGWIISLILSSLTILHNTALLKPIYFPGWDWPKPSNQQPRYSCWGDLDFITNIVRLWSWEGVFGTFLSNPAITTFMNTCSSACCT